MGCFNCGGSQPNPAKSLDRGPGTENSQEAWALPQLTYLHPGMINNRCKCMRGHCWIHSSVRKTPRPTSNTDGLKALHCCPGWDFISFDYFLDLEHLDRNLVTLFVKGFGKWSRAIWWWRTSIPHLGPHLLGKVILLEPAWPRSRNLTYDIGRTVSTEQPLDGRFDEFPQKGQETRHSS